VLITLAIIGIIAAITIPSIIANHKKRTLETQFTKSYRTITQAMNLAIAEHGALETWDWKDNMTKQEMDELVKKYFVPYLNVVKFCSAVNPQAGGCFSDEFKTPNGKMTAEGSRPNNRYYPKLLLADGSSIQFLITPSGLSTNTRTVALEVDINGFKKPNTIGLDNFAFNFYPHVNEMQPHGVYKAYDAQTDSYIKFTDDEIDANCNKNGSGWHCAVKIVKEGFKMNYDF